MQNRIESCRQELLSLLAENGVESEALNMASVIFTRGVTIAEKQGWSDFGTQAIGRFSDMIETGNLCPNIYTTTEGD